MDDKDVGFYLAINSIGHGPLFIDSSKFALITEQKYANNQVKEIHIIDLSDLANPVLFSKIDLGKDITTIYDIEVTKDEKRLFVTVPRSLKIFNIKILVMFISFMKKKFPPLVILKLHLMAVIFIQTGVK